MRLPAQNQGVARCGKRDFVHALDNRPLATPAMTARVPDRRRPPALLGPARELPPVAQRRAADPVPLRRLPRDPPPLPAARLPRGRGAVTRRRNRSTSKRSGIRAIRVGEMRYVARAAPRARPADGRGRAGVARPRRRGARPRAARRRFAFVRSVRHKPRANPSPADGAPGGMTDAKWRAGFRALARHGLRFDLQTPWWHLARSGAARRPTSRHADHPQSHRPAGRSQRRRHRRLAARDGDARRVPERRR